MFAYVFVLPPGYKYFLGYSDQNMGLIREVLGQSIDIKLSQPFSIRPMITLDEIFGLTSMLLLVFGLVFELPLALSVLALLGVVSAGMLWKFNRYAILIFACLGAVLGPDEPSYLLWGPRLERRVHFLPSTAAVAEALRGGLFRVVVSTGENAPVAGTFAEAGWRVRRLADYWLLAEAPGAEGDACRGRG